MIDIILNVNATDNKIFRTRAAIIVNAGRLIRWYQAGIAHVLDERGEWAPFVE
jgi:hypothetical protein